MKKYRIKNNNVNGYILQERWMWLKWLNITGIWHDESLKSTILGFNELPLIFETLKEARACIKDVRESEKRLKKAKYTEYL